MKLSKTKSALAIGAVLALSAGAANANVWSFAGTMTFIDTSGTVGHVDTLVTGVFDLTAGTGSFASGIPFNGEPWTADVDALFMTPGAGQNYNWRNKQIFTGTEVVNCRTGTNIDGCAGIAGSVLVDVPGVGYDFDLGAGSAGLGQFAAGVFFDWSVNDDIPVLTVLDILDDMSDGVFAVSSDGTPMATAPFPGQTAAFAGTMTCTDCAPPPIPEIGRASCRERV